MSYKPILICYSGCAEEAARRRQLDRLLAYPEMVVTYRGYGQLAGCVNRVFGSEYGQTHMATIEPALYRYVNFYSAAYEAAVLAPYPAWFPGPKDIRYDADVQVQGGSGGGAWVYRQDKDHWIHWTLAAAMIGKKYPRQAGIFIDDFTDYPNYYRLTDEQKDNIWPDWRDGGMYETLEDVEGASRAFAAMNGVDGHRQKVIVNGNARTRGPRMYEGIGHWVLPSELEEAGDIGFVKGLKADGETWAKVTRQNNLWPIGTSFKDVFKYMLEVAEKQSFRVALGYAERPVNGSSTAGWHAFSDPKTWEKL